MSVCCSLVCQLRHPNIVRFHDFFDEDEELKIVMELVTGDDAFETMQKKVGPSFFCFKFVCIWFHHVRCLPRV